MPGDFLGMSIPEYIDQAVVSRNLYLRDLLEQGFPIPIFTSQHFGGLGNKDGFRDLLSGTNLFSTAIECGAYPSWFSVFTASIDNFSFEPLAAKSAVENPRKEIWVQIEFSGKCSCPALQLLLHECKGFFVNNRLVTVFYIVLWKFTAIDNPFLARVCSHK